MKLVIDKAKESGMSVDEIAEKLGVTFEWYFERDVLAHVLFFIADY